MAEKTFVSGLYLNRVAPTAPAFIITNQEIHVEKLMAWLQQHKHLANAGGYIKIVGLESSEKKDDRGNPKRYFEIDTREPKPKEGEITKEDIPF